MDGVLAVDGAATLAAVIARTRVADLHVSGLADEESEQLLREQGFSARVELVAA